MLSKEHNALQLATRKRITELECKESEMSKKLTVYEKMEDELDDVIMQAAESKLQPNIILLHIGLIDETLLIGCAE